MYSQFMTVLRQSSFPVWVLSFYIFIWFLQIGDRINILGQIRIEFIVGLFLIICSCMNLNKERNLNPSSYDGFLKTIYFLYFIIIVYTVVSYDRDHSWDVFSDRVMKFSMFTFFFALLVKRKAELVLVLIGLLLAMSKIIEEGVLGVLTGGLVWQNQGIPRLHGATGLFRHPNSLSGFAVSALPFFLFLFQYQSRILKCAFAGAIVGLLIMILYTGSRTGYVASIILFMAVLLRVGIFKPKTIISLVVLLTVAMIVIPQDYKDRFGTMFKSHDEMGSSANKRLEILDDAFAIAKKYPFGVGVQAFPHVRDMEFGRLQDTHNLYLEIYTNLGPIGFIVFIAFIYQLFRVNSRSRLFFQEKNERFLAEMCYLVNIYIVCRLALGFFGMDLYEVYWWIAAGFTIALAKMVARYQLKGAAALTE